MPEIYPDNLISQVLLTPLGCPHVTGKNASLKQILIFTDHVFLYKKCLIMLAFLINLHCTI